MLQLDGEREWLARPQHEVVARTIKAGSFSPQRVGASFHGSKTKFADRIAGDLLDNGAFGAFQRDRRSGDDIAGVVADEAFNWGLGADGGRYKSDQKKGNYELPSHESIPQGKMKREN